MNQPGSQPRLISFAGHRNVSDKAALGLAIRRELTLMRETLGPRLTAFSSAAAGADLIFLRACVELRIPAIVILPFTVERFAEDFDDHEEWEMARHLMSVSLAKYVAPGENEGLQAHQAISRHLIEWADAFLFVSKDEPQRGEDDNGETMGEARDLGIPARIIDTQGLAARWSFEPDPNRKARHGFGTRKELLEFLDARLGTPIH